MIYYKGFNSKLQCQPNKDKEPFQFEVGKTYEEDSAELCKSGFHACANPLDVLRYYSPFDSRYCMVELEDVQKDKTQPDSKVCGKKIRIVAEISFKRLIYEGLSFAHNKASEIGCDANAVIVSSTAPWSHAVTAQPFKHSINTGSESLSAATGSYNISVNAGNYSAAVNTGDRGDTFQAGDMGVAVNTGALSHATSTGRASAAVVTGFRDYAVVSGEGSVAVALGIEGKAKAALGCWLVLAEWKQDENGDWHRVEVHSAPVDGEKIKADTFYKLQDGQFVEVE